MRALSIRQPWAEMIMAGVKQTENRRWGTTYRGLLLVHAAKRYADEHPSIPSYLTEGPRGAYVGTVELVHICRAARDVTSFRECECDDRWAEIGAVHWRLANPRRLYRPIPGPGRLGLYEPPETVQAAVRQAIGR